MKNFEEMTNDKSNLFLFLGKSPAGIHDLKRISNKFTESICLDVRSVKLIDILKIILSILMGSVKVDNVIFIHSSPYNYIFFILFLFKNKFIIVHNPIGQISRRGLFGVLDDLVFKMTLHIFDKYIFLSEHVAETYNSNKEKFLLTGSELVKASGKENKGSGVFFFGRYLPYKNVEWVVELAKEVHPFSVTIVSEGFDLSTSDLALNDIKNLKIVSDWFPEEKVSQLYSDNNILVLPYSEVSQSGPFWLGIEHSNKIIVPDLPWFCQYRNNENVFLFEANNQIDFFKIVKNVIMQEKT